MTDAEFDLRLLETKHYELCHYHQRFNWDCGISCVLMLLTPQHRQYFIENFDNICETEGFGNSTWTIDLCYLLLRFKIRHEYFTKTLGVDPNYKTQSYYQKIIDKDEQRVTSRFEEACKKGIIVAQRTVDIAFILKHLVKHGPVILLTNSSFLICMLCRRKELNPIGCLSLICFFHRKPRSYNSYAGHYVVLCGYDGQQQLIYYRNPETNDGHICFCSAKDMDTARKAYGTDEDALFIYCS